MEIRHDHLSFNGTIKNVNRKFVKTAIVGLLCFALGVGSYFVFEQHNQNKENDLSNNTSNEKVEQLENPTIDEYKKIIETMKNDPNINLSNLSQLDSEDKRNNYIEINSQDNNGDKRKVSGFVGGEAEVSGVPTNPTTELSAFGGVNIPVNNDKDTLTLYAKVGSSINNLFDTNFSAGIGGVYSFDSKNPQVKKSIMQHELFKPTTYTIDRSGGHSSGGSSGGNTQDPNTSSTDKPSIEHPDEQTPNL